MTTKIENPTPHWVSRYQSSTSSTNNNTKIATKARSSITSATLFIFQYTNSRSSRRWKTLSTGCSRMQDIGEETTRTLFSPLSVLSLTLSRSLHWTQKTGKYAKTASSVCSGFLPFLSHLRTTPAWDKACTILPTSSRLRLNSWSYKCLRPEIRLLMMENHEKTSLWEENWTHWGSMEAIAMRL